jgi:hypothetical protein
MDVRVGRSARTWGRRSSLREESRVAAARADPAAWRAVATLVVWMVLVMRAAT